MAFTSLYRRYRPTTFAKVLGQDHIIKTLVNQINSNNVGHAYIFTGTRGTGKTSVAKIFAKAVNCLHPVNGSPCGTCEVCLGLALDDNFDIVELDAASNNGVEQIRDIINQVSYTPSIGKYKVYIIDEVHMLSKAAFNALLKTLEEPPKYAIFILATTEVSAVPATILSRCLRFDFRLVSKKVLTEHICNIFDELTVKYEVPAVELIAQAGNGSVRDALSIADMCMSYCMGDITYNGVLEVLGANDPEIIVNYIKAANEGDLEKVLLLTDEICAKGKSISMLAQDLADAYRNIIYIKTCKDARKIVNLPNETYAALENISKEISNEKCLDNLKKLNSLYSAFRYTTQHRIIFEATMVEITKGTSSADVAALQKKVAVLEKAIKSGVVVQPQQGSFPSKSQVKPGDLWKVVIDELKNRGQEMLVMAATTAVCEETETEFIANFADKSQYNIIANTTKPIGVPNAKSNKELITEVFSGVCSKVLVIRCNVVQDKNNSLPYLKEMFGNRLNILK